MVGWTQNDHPGNIGGSALLDNAKQQAFMKQHAAILSAAGGAVGSENGRVVAPPEEQRSDVSNFDNARCAEQQKQQREPPPPSTIGKPPLNKALLMAQYYAMASKLARQQQQPQQQQPPPKKQLTPRPQRVITPGMIARRPIETKHNIIMRSGNDKKSTDSVSGSVNTDATEQIYNTKLANSRRKKNSASFQPTLERLDTFEPGETIESSSRESSISAPELKNETITITNRDINLSNPEELKKSQSTKSDVSKNSLKTEAEFVLQNSPRNDVTHLLTIDNEYLNDSKNSSAVNRDGAQSQVSPLASAEAVNNDRVHDVEHISTVKQEDSQKHLHDSKNLSAVSQDFAQKLVPPEAVNIERVHGVEHTTTANQEDAKKQMSSLSPPDTDLTKIAVGLGTQLEQINSKVEHLQKELILLAHPNTFGNTSKHTANKDSKSEESIESREDLKDDSKISDQTECNSMESSKQKHITGQNLSVKSNRRMDLVELSKDSDESGLSIAMKSTLSHAEFFSVQSSITTDQEVFKQRPGVLKRTASLVRNPALALRRSKANKEAEELTKRIKHAQTLARHDNRTKEVHAIIAHPRCEVDDCSNDIIQNDAPEIFHTRNLIDSTNMIGTNVVQYHATDSDELPFNDLVLGVESMYEETDIILDTNGTFDHPSTRDQRRMAQPHQASQAYTPPYYYDVVASVPSKETATQTTPLENNTAGSDVGSISNVMESLGLFGARFCMGTSKVMLSCADSCSDNPNGKKVVDQRLSSLDNEVMARLSPRNGTVTSREPIPMHQTPPSTRGYGSLPPFVDKKESEQDAAGIFTRALSMALQTRFGEGNHDQQPTSLKQQEHNNLPQNHKQHPKQKTKKQAYADFESIDGRFVTPDQLHRRTAKHVPRNIAVTPKRKYRHESLHHARAASDGSNSGKSEDTPQVKKPSKSSKKGLGKLFHKIGLTR
jgi:hypothetical protein